MVKGKGSYIPGVSENVDKYVRENLQRIGFFPHGQQAVAIILLSDWRNLRKRNWPNFHF